MFYGTLEGYLKAVDAKTGKELYKFKTPSGIIGNVTTYEHGGKQYIAGLLLLPISGLPRSGAIFVLVGERRAEWDVSAVESFGFSAR